MMIMKNKRIDDASDEELKQELIKREVIRSLRDEIAKLRPISIFQARPEPGEWVLAFFDNDDLIEKDSYSLGDFECRVLQYCPYGKELDPEINFADLDGNMIGGEMGHWPMQKVKYWLPSPAFPQPIKVRLKPIEAE